MIVLPVLALLGLVAFIWLVIKWAYALFVLSHRILEAA